MAENKIRNTHKNDSDVQDLLAVLDRMQNRPHVAEVEEVLVNSGRPDLVRMDIYAPPKEKGFIPTASTDKLEDLLVSPGENGGVHYIQPGQTRVRVENDESTDELKDMMYGEEVPDEEEWFRVAPRPEQRTNAAVAFFRGVGMAIPGKGDSLLRIVSKIGFWVALLAALLAAVILVKDMQIAPQRNQTLIKELQALYDGDNEQRVSDTKTYPAGMLASFKKLYERNSDIKGWVSFHAEGNDFLNVELPFVQGKDNAYYRTHDYDGNKSDYGTLFVDADAKINGYKDTDRVLVIRGNNTPDQTMLSGMNRLFGPVEYGRVAPELELTTLYRRDTYYVFATALFDGTGKDPYNPFDTDFANEEEFNKYVRSLCARSLFDYPVDVQYSDSLVLLAVPTGDSSSGLQDGMLVVAARRARYDYTEDEVSPNQIMKNKDALMPYSWYISRGRTPKAFVEPEEPVEEESTQPTTPHEPVFPDDDTTDSTTDSTTDGTTTSKKPIETMDPHDGPALTRPTEDATSSTIYNGEQVTKFPPTSTTTESTP